MSGRGTVDTKNTARCKHHCYCRVSGRGTVDTKNTADVNIVIVVSGRDTVDTENTANVNTVIAECQVEVQYALKYC